MKKKIKIFGLFSIALAIGAGSYALFSGTKNSNTYQFAEIIRGNLVNTVSSTGTIYPVGIVEVGTQVSGIIEKIYVDFNDQVKKGQMLAVLNMDLLKTSILDAEANVEQVEAQLEEANWNFQRSQSLFERELISEAEYLPTQMKVKTLEASLKSAEASLERAQTNLKYAVIRSPINGTVIQKSVEEGQTVAASLSAPTLFIIAEDLSQMEIHAYVDESDIGQIQEGQSVNFEVQTYPDDLFHGNVKQIRLQPTTVQNVVNYTVVVEANNEQNLLLPGMTATIDFVVEEKKDVLLVSNAALRFQPSIETVEELKNEREKERLAVTESPRNLQNRQMVAKQKNNFSENEVLKELKTIWYFNDQGTLNMQVLETGSTDGKMTEIVMGPGIEEGMEVISGTLQVNDKKEMKNFAGIGVGRRPL